MKGYIYKIFIKDCPEFDKIYIGATTRKPCKRVAEHKYKFNKGIKDTRSFYIYEYANQNNLNVEYETIEEIEYNNLVELFYKEFLYIASTDNAINKI